MSYIIIITTILAFLLGMFIKSGLIESKNEDIDLHDLHNAIDAINRGHLGSAKNHIKKYLNKFK